MATEAFSPGSATVSVASSGSSSAATFIGKGGPNVRIWNSSASNTAYLEIGGESVAAATTSSYPLPAGVIEVIRCAGDYARVISDSATVYFTRGDGI